MANSIAGRVLCVDDESSGLHLRKLILEKHGYSVETATNPSDALQQFRQNQFALVITDHLLGRGTGTAMVAEMKQISPEIPIIVLSGTVEVPEGLGFADAFLSKTEGPESLLAKIKEMISARAASNVARGALPYGPKKALQEPGLQRLLLAALVESSDDAIFSKTLDGTIITWNKAAERTYGYTQQEAIGKNVSMLVPPERIGELREILSRMKKGEKIDHLETHRVAKDGRPVMVSLTISPIRDPEGNLLGAATIARDLTEVRLAEQALRSSERLATAGRMAATVAHEINNPLEAVTNILYLLEQSTNLDPTARQFVAMAEHEIAHIRQIAQLTLKYHRETNVRLEQVRVTDLVEGVLILYGRRIQTLRLSVQKEYEGEAVVEGMAGELRQVISNLIVNAIDALESSGNKLRIRVRDAFDRNRQKGVRVIIADDGPGIPHQHLRGLFQPFFTTKGDKGTGLGLWVSRGIIEKHGGTLRVRSNTEPGHSGTIFSLFLPAQAEKTQQRIAA